MLNANIMLNGTAVVVAKGVHKGKVGTILQNTDDLLRPFKRPSYLIAFTDGTRGYVLHGHVQHDDSKGHARVAARMADAVDLIRLDMFPVEVSDAEILAELAHAVLAARAEAMGVSAASILADDLAAVARGTDGPVASEVEQAAIRLLADTEVMVDCRDGCRDGYDEDVAYVPLVRFNALADALRKRGVWD